MFNTFLDGHKLCDKLLAAHCSVTSLSNSKEFECRSVVSKPFVNTTKLRETHL